MPRRNLPGKARVAWNVAFRQILLARAGADSLTEYTQQMSVLVKETEKTFRNFSEKWIKGKSIANADTLAEHVEGIIGRVNALACAAPATSASSSTFTESVTREDDTLGALLTGVLGNLIPRMGRIPSEPGIKAAATFAGSLAEQAHKHGNSAIWRTTSSPPLTELSSLARRLSDVTKILHEMAYDSTATPIAAIVNAAKKSGFMNGVGAAARYCEALANRRLRSKLQRLEAGLKERGFRGKCWTRPVEGKDSVYWPPIEIAILVQINDFSADARYIEESIALGQEYIGQDWRFRTVPVINGQVIPTLALIPSAQMPLPDTKFREEWQNNIKIPFHLPIVSEAFDAAVSACTQVSSIANCRDLDNLHPVEADVLAKAIRAFESNYKRITAAKQESNIDELNEALDYLNEVWNQVVTEVETVNSGQKNSNPYCMDTYLALSGGNQGERISRLAALRVLLQQAECRMTTGAS